MNVCMWLNERMVSWMWMRSHATGWVNGQWIEWLCCMGSVVLCNTGWKLSCSPLTMQYTTIRVCEREGEGERKKTKEWEDKREIETGIKSFQHWRLLSSPGLTEWMESAPTPLQTVWHHQHLLQNRSTKNSNHMQLWFGMGDCGFTQHVFKYLPKWLHYSTF